jgi:Na+-transporting NADH:ubiquinone oxidoreductase subunit B
MKGSHRWRLLAQLLDDAVLGYPASTSGAPHIRVPTGAQGLHLQFIVGSLPIALLVAGNGLLARATLLVIALLTATFWECLFAWKRQRPVDEGILLTAWLFALIVPPDTPLLQAVASISFGVVFGKAVFGGDGRYLVSPPLLALVFLVFAYPDTVIDPVGWTPVPGEERLAALACLFGAAWLIATGSASWRIITGAVIGLLIAVAIDSLTGPAATATSAAWYWPLVSGGFAFGVVFIATDPTASAMTNPGRFASGVLTGLLSYLVGAMFAILLASLFAPLFDAAAVAVNIRRRRARERRS